MNTNKNIWNTLHQILLLNTLLYLLLCKELKMDMDDFLISRVHNKMTILLFKKLSASITNMILTSYLKYLYNQ